ncbi:hypothetical protein BGZ60DRAFT_565165 [Tricladium varicosporioides]|nr:hypothetical protein BGZ60DRAFT_565165 [Hymenoscyphus varicosporioides]
MAKLLKVLIIISTLGSLPGFPSSPAFALAADPVAFTNFDYFKNSGLKFCGNTTSVQHIAARDPKGGGKGGGGGGGGSSSSSGGGSRGRNGAVKPFIDSKSFARGSSSYCQYMNGTGVIIPTIPNQIAFFPWWPTYTAQLITLLLSYSGLVYTVKQAEKFHKVPLLFWLQIPIDTARLVAWFFKVAHGLAVPNRFAWTSVVLWLLPVAYIYVIHAIWPVTKVANIVSTKAAYQPVAQRDLHGQQTHEYINYDNQQAYGHGPPGYVQDNDSMLKQSTANTTTAKTQRPASFIVGILLGLISVIMWGITLATIVYHFQFAGVNNQRTETYLQDPRTTSDPSILGSLPTACVNFLKGYSLQEHGMFWSPFNQLFSAGITAVQFLIVSLAVIKIAWKRFKGGAISKLGGVVDCMVATLTALILAVLATAIYIGVVAGAQKKSVSFSFTTNTNTTGGCTFGFVEMDSTFGYWEVPYELGFRIAMSALGAA